MSLTSSPFDGISVASPCSVSWDDMEGDEAIRFCAHCRLHVYNLSGMDRAAGEALVQNAEGRLCVRFFRRADGTLLTRDCPVGLRAIRRKALKFAGLAAGALLAAAACTFTMAAGHWNGPSSRVGILRNSGLRQVEPFASMLEWLDPAPQVQMMGAIVAPARSSTRSQETASGDPKEE